MSKKTEVTMACSKCGGRRYSVRTVNNNGVKSTLINIPELGDVDSREPIQVTYAGVQQSEKRMIGKGLPGQGSVVYRFSGNPNGTHGPTFNFIAIDYHLFAKGPYKDFQRVQKSVEKEVKYDDFTILKHIGPVIQNKMRDAGLSYYSDIVAVDPKKLSHVLGFNKDKTLEVIADVTRLLEVKV